MKLLALLSLVVVLLSCGKDSVAGTSSDVDIITGIVVSNTGKPVGNTLVKLYRDNGDSVHRNAIDSTFSDANGVFTFDSMNGGIYDLESNYKDSLFAVRQDVVHGDKSNTLLDADTLYAPGAISGQIITDEKNRQGILVYIPGTSYDAHTDSSGNFVISRIPAGKGYAVSCQAYGYSMQTVSDINVTVGDTTEIDPIHLSRNIFPTGVTTIFDTTNGTVTVSWKKMVGADIEGYFVYRKLANQSGAVPAQISAELCKDSFYIDTLPDELFSRDSLLTLQYQVRGVDSRENLTPYSNKTTVSVWSTRNAQTKKTIAVIDSTFPLVMSGESRVEIQWNYTGLIEKVGIDLSVNDGDTWLPIENNVKNYGYFFWNSVYNFSSDSCRIRIRNSDDSTCFDISERFKITYDPNKNLLRNGDFTARGSDWNVHIGDTSTANSFYVDTTGIGILRCHSIPKEAWMFNVNQLGIPLRKGSAYTISFKAKCTKPNQRILVVLQEGRAPWSDYGMRKKLLDTTWTTIEDTLFMARDDDASAYFVFSPDSVEQATIYLDDVVLKRFN